MNLDNVYALGLEKFAGDQKLATEFMEGFQKEANIPGFGDMFYTAPSTQKEGRPSGILPGILEGLGKGVGGALVAGAVGVIGAGASALGNGQLHNKYMSNLEKVIQTNPLLRSANKAKVIQYGDTIFRFAPHIACDPNVLSSVLAGAIDGEGIDPNTIKLLVDLEGRVKDNGSFSPKAYV